jgi:pSer/pThr/pTyr-binding forkhead associated (FHA) protein
MAMRAKLITRSGVLNGNENVLSSDLLRIGRDPANDFVVEDIEVSRNHAKISCDKEIYRIEDLNSTNGTFINGRKISTPEALKDGDLIRLGENNVYEFSLIKENQKDESPSFREHNLEENVQKNLLAGSEIELNSENINDVLITEDDSKNLLNTLSKFPTWAVILVILLGFIILFCIIPVILIEITNQWCNLFSGFFNAISPGVCP